MDFCRYAEQVERLGRYAVVPEIPRDAYDIPVALAKRLLSYVCRCWRWNAFSGQAKYLLARRDYEAKEIANVWVLEDGCGGASNEHR